MKPLVRNLLAALLSLDIGAVIDILSIELNPFSARRRRPRISRYIRYTRDVLKGDDFEIGEYTYGIPTVLKNPGTKVKIGKFCSLSAGLVLELRGDHTAYFVTTYPFGSFLDDWKAAKYIKPEQYLSRKKQAITIGNDVWVGINVTILSGVTVGDGAVIGAGSVVVKDVEPYSVVAGNPARVIRKRFDDETIRALLQIRWWDWSIEKINDSLQILLSENMSELFHLQ